jgi:hypothetical protein
LAPKGGCRQSAQSKGEGFPNQIPAAISSRFRAMISVRGTGQGQSGKAGSMGSMHSGWRLVGRSVRGRSGGVHRSCHLYQQGGQGVGAPGPNRWHGRGFVAPRVCAPAYYLISCLGPLRASGALRQNLPQKGPSRPWGFWRVDAKTGQQVAVGKGVAESESLAKGVKMVRGLRIGQPGRSSGISKIHTQQGTQSVVRPLRDGKSQTTGYLCPGKPGPEGGGQRHSGAQVCQNRDARGAL